MNFNPCDRVTPPKAVKVPKKIYDLEQTGLLLKALEGEELRHRLMVLICITTGMRNEELFGIRWQDVSSNFSVIYIRQARVYTGKEYGTITKETKNSGSTRAVSLPPDVTELLKKHRAKESSKKLKKGKDWQGSELVFTTWDGSDMHPQALRCFLSRFTKEHNLPPISPHAFRHMAATFLINAGTDIRTVSGKLGHSKTSTTTDIYSHLLLKAESQTADTMARILETARQKADEIKKPAPKKQAKSR